MQRNKKRKLNIPMYVAALLFALTVLTVFFMPRGLYAKYKTHDTAGDGARVAKFSVSSTLEDSEAYTFNISNMLPGQSETYTIKVTNDSEVAVKCTVSVINTTGNIPLKFTITDSDGTARDDSITESFSPESRTHTYTLTVLWEQSEGEDNFTANGTVDKIEISVNSEQID